MLLAAIDENHKGTYDFIYLPIDFKVMMLAERGKSKSALRFGYNENFVDFLELIVSQLFVFAEQV